MSKNTCSRFLSVIAVGIASTLSLGRVDAASPRDGATQANAGKQVPASALDSWRMRARQAPAIQPSRIQQAAWMDSTTTTSQTLWCDPCPQCPQHIGHHFAHWVKSKLMYFTPSGCCGSGCPPVGFYHRVYAVAPDYFDPRDGQVYAAPGTGVPMAVPLAPNVHYTYNYGVGIPSSRLTPISHVVPPQRAD